MDFDENQQQNQEDLMNENTEQLDETVQAEEIAQPQQEAQVTEQQWTAEQQAQWMPPQQPQPQQQPPYGYGNNYYQYQQNIKSMKAEMRVMKKEAKKQQKAARKAGAANGQSHGVSGVYMGLLMFISAIVGCALALVLIAMVPNTENSLLANLVKKYGTQETHIIQEGGQSGNITITDETTSAVKAVYQKAAKSVVGIRVVSITDQFFNKTETIISEGSGVVYSEDGLIITNHHVVGDALSDAVNTNYEIRVYLDNGLEQFYKAEIIGSDSDTDLALLKINVTGLTPIEFADYSTVEIGDTAIAIGSAGGLEYMNSISEGIVSGLNRDITTSTGVSFELIQTTAAINPGNSGGALLNSEGQLIGICVIKIAATEYEGMGFAINGNTIQSVITSIQENGSVERPLLGVTVRTDYTSEMAQAYNYPAGAYVYSVTEGSCADVAGIEADDIIYQFGDVELTGYSDLKKALNRYNIGDTVVLKIYRLTTGEHLEVTVTLTK